jgi:alkyl hydroperoxide reductase subunit AhpF
MLISGAHRDQLRRLFEEELQSDVRITLCATESQRRGEPGGLLSEITALSRKLTLAETISGEDGALTPSIRIEGALKGALRFVGLPTGYELPVFVDSIIAASRGRSKLSPSSISRISALNSAVSVSVYTTPT